MSFVVLYLGTRHDVYGFNTLRDITICLFYVTLTFDLHLWPSSSLKVTIIFIIRWTLCCCVLVPSTKFVGSIKFEIWTIVLRKLKWRHNDLSSFRFLWNLNTNRPRVYLSDISKFILIEHKRADIQIREVNREFWRIWYSYRVLRHWDLDLKSRSKRLMSLDVAYCIVPWYHKWCLLV